MTDQKPELESPAAFARKLEAERELAAAIAEDRKTHTWTEIRRGLAGIDVENYPDGVPVGTMENWLRRAGLRPVPPSIATLREQRDGRKR